MVRVFLLLAALLTPKAFNTLAFVAPTARGASLLASSPRRGLAAPASLPVAAKPRQRTTTTTTTMAARVPWRTVFLAEYGGPIAIFPAVAAVSASSPCAVKLATALWMFHFSKRFLETLFVHSFSKASMPLTNLFKNCGYYYSAAALVAWDVARRGDVGISKAAAVAFFAFEALNGYTHLHLAGLRADGSREAKVPTAWPFRYVCSPNYTFEILSWVSFTLAFRSPAAAAFTLVGAAQMAVWSRGKLKRYKRKFNDEHAFTATKALVPGVF